ncbi:hypothetical protein SmJEL517_g04439 [Synchytrium microbalum]|uniref:sn-1-specific diacylglycerol lipase n=1 Tax=Synchytrium microbalum TaxID=1806994 RepID=A0A507C3B1_9FUNG|nr:uncharacterized protein SmJEL517_g04439 [Synchytrium microbalum]TPX32436.1 hypothetical protein SmJEL517_g04439 [Synchytrium microbalum]
MTSSLSQEQVRFVNEEEVQDFETTVIEYGSDDDIVFHDAISSPELEDNEIVPDITNTIVNTTTAPILPPLLNESCARAISSVSIATRIALRLSQIVVEAFFETLRYSTTSSLSFTRHAIVAALSAASSQRSITSSQQMSESYFFTRVLDRYTTAGVYFVHNIFSLAELFSMSSFHLVSRTIQLSLKSAEEAVRVLDGLFGSTETSRALAAFVYLVKNELDQWRHDLALTYPAPFGQVFAVGSVTKGITAYSCLQYVSRKRLSAKALRLTPVFEAVIPSVATTPELSQLSDALSRHGFDKIPARGTTVPSLPSPSRRQDLLPVLQHRRGDSAVCLSVPHDEEFDSESSAWGQVKRTLSTSRLKLGTPSTPRASRWSSGTNPTQQDTKRRHKSLPRNIGLNVAVFTETVRETVVMVHDTTQPSYLIPSSPTREKCSRVFDWSQSTTTTTTTSSTSKAPNAPKPNEVPSLLPLSSTNSPDRINTSINNSQPAPQPGPASPMHSNLPSNRQLWARLSRFLGFACGAYGTHFVRILGLERAQEPVESAEDHHHNVQTFASLAGIPLECILTSSFTKPKAFAQPTIKALVHYVAVDPATKSIVLTLRGTLGLSDLLTDLTCDYANYATDVATGFVHAGMLKSAKKLCESAVAEVVAGALKQYPGFGLVLCGHSLGGGVAALLATMWADVQKDGSFVTKRGFPEGRPVHCYCYGPPSTMSAEMSKAYKKLITCVVFRNDVIPCLSLGLIRDFKTVAVALAQERGTAEKVISRALHIFRGSVPSDWDADADDVWEWALLKTLRAGMSADKTFPPGTVYWIQATPSLCNPSSLVVGGNNKKDSSGGASKNSSNSVGGDGFIAGKGNNISGNIGGGRASSSNLPPPLGIKTTLKEPQSCTLTMHRCEDVEAAFSEAHFSTTMFADHAPSSYATALEALVNASRHISGVEE